MKLGIIIDSSAGLSKKEAEEKGWNFLPLFMNINGKDIADGIDMTSDVFYDTIKLEDEVRTSATPPGVILDMFEKTSREYDHVIVYGLSSGLSSQTNNLTTFAKDFENIHVIQSLGVGPVIESELDIAERMNNEGKDIKEIVDSLNESTKELFGVAFPKQMKWLVKGGRVSSSAAAMANLLKIVPIISLKEGKLDKYGKGRVFNKTIKKTITSLKEEYKDKQHQWTIYTGEFAEKDEAIKTIREVLGDVEVKHFPPVIAIHTGPEVIAIINHRK